MKREGEGEKECGDWRGRAGPDSTAVKKRKKEPQEDEVESGLFMNAL
jgi:hypothetical protein